MSAARSTTWSRPATPRCRRRDRHRSSAAENQLSGALGRLIALSEAYPDLKANANFQQLASELSDLENKIAASRRFFNNAVQEYNTGIQQMPAALFAGMFGFTRKDFFDLGASRTEVEAGADGEVLSRNASRQSSASWPRTVSTRTSHRTNFVRCCCSPACSC